MSRITFTLFAATILACLDSHAALHTTYEVMEMQPAPKKAATLSVFTNNCPGYQASSIIPPSLNREFRAAWISSVGENSWLNGLTGKSSASQRSALLSMIERAQQLKLNAIIFQVRPSCDALYASSIEPWSEHLTGTQGRAPHPAYDPLEFVVEEAHKRGLEVHAWFNPYRAYHADAKSPRSSNHISRTRPELVRSYGKYLWLDPGERDVQEYSLRVVMDVVKRYDIDGVHFDDYFYPYREKDANSQLIDFPDEASWRKYGAYSNLSRDDWRRENVNTFIQRVQNSIHATKPWVKFGISPFGIWRPGFPPQIKGKDAYAELYADARKWIQNGWADYFSPQLYWNIENPEQSFPVLLRWWNDQNAQHRHLWPGLDITKVTSAKWKPEETAAQIRITRQVPGSAGQVLWGMRNLMLSPNGLSEKIQTEIYKSPALVPATPWLTTNATPGKPTVTTTLGKNSVKISWSKSNNIEVGQWIIQLRENGNWFTDILPATRTNTLISGLPEAIAITTIDRVNRASLPTVLQLNR